MRNRTQRGGILAAFAGFLLFLLATAAIAAVIISQIRVHQEDTRNGGRVSIETPLGSMKIDARNNLRPDTVGIPVYPGAIRERNNAGGLMFDFDDYQGAHKELAIMAASYSTSDPADKVQAFYSQELPHWVFTRAHDKLNIEYSKDGYKRIIAVEERNGVTHIGIASVGEPGVN